MIITFCLLVHGLILQESTTVVLVVLVNRKETINGLGLVNHGQNYKGTEMTTLHITNGDTTVDLLKAAKVEGDYLPWRDVLHMGPVPLMEDLAQLSAIRANYLASLGWGDIDKLNQDFQNRDQKLMQYRHYDKVLLWFEHDLYDQLQLLQVLSWLEQDNASEHNISLINPGKHLGHHGVDEVDDLLNIQKPVTAQQYQLSTRAWLAFRQKDSAQWKALIDEDTSCLPFLRKAIVRSLGELPDTTSGINQTEKMMLSLIAQGCDTPKEMFRQYCQLEEDMFLGDTGFFLFLEQLQCDQPALVEQQDGVLRLTPLGNSVLKGDSTWQRAYSQPRWLGGFCISSANK